MHHINYWMLCSFMKHLVNACRYGLEVDCAVRALLDSVLPPSGMDSRAGQLADMYNDELKEVGVGATCRTCVVKESCTVKDLFGLFFPNISCIVCVGVWVDVSLPEWLHAGRADGSHDACTLYRGQSMSRARTDQGVS